MCNFETYHIQNNSILQLLNELESAVIKQFDHFSGKSIENIDVCVKLFVTDTTKYTKVYTKKPSSARKSYN